MLMETRLTLRPGQSGTKKVLERYGELLVRVRYRYDHATGRRLKTVELVVESVAWRPRPRRLRRRDDEIVAVRIAWHKPNCASAPSASARSGVRRRSFGN
jgi:hypothetical protein